MLNPIKRIWVAPHARPAQPAAPAPQAQKAPDPGLDVNLDDYLLSELPEPEVEEKDSDSIWAEFESAHAAFTSSK